jgi:predicted 2-oxoglutarate/Fe(II)-dependent dioxygenase YbiX
MKYNWYYYNNIYTQDQCKEINELAHSNIVPHYTDRAPDWKNLKVSAILTDSMRDKLKTWFDISHQTNEEQFGYDVFGDPRTINLNEYNVGESYDWHLDCMEMGMTADIKFTSILNISTEPYVGGDLELFERRNVKIDTLAPGSILIFPTVFYHRVLPIISGKRTTLSMWFTGPAWK